MNDLPMDLPRVIKLAGELAELTAGPDNHTGILRIKENEVLVNNRRMHEVAPLDQWTLNQPREVASYFPYSHTILIDGVTFEAITEQPIELTQPEVQQ